MHAIWNKATCEPCINPQDPSAGEVWVKKPKWLVLATVDVYDQANFPGNPIPVEALTSDGRLLICMTQQTRKVKIEVLRQDVRLKT